MSTISLSNMVIPEHATHSRGCGVGATEGVNQPGMKKPDWIRAKMPSGQGYKETKALMDKYGLHTVCESAKCPNLGECWDRKTATLMILGGVCTRRCGFCHVMTGVPPEYDLDEPRRVGETAALLGLRHIVVTSVDRDELPDGGAEVWAETIREIRRQSPGTQVEILIPDFNGDWDALQLVLDERPDILAQNLETVKRLTRTVRPQARYERTIELLRRAKAQGLTVKTGIMTGLGETAEEVQETIRDLVAGVRVAGVGSNEPARNSNAHRSAPHPNRNLSEDGRAEAQRRAQVSGEGKREVGEKMKRGGYLTDHDKPYWSHHGPAKPADAALRISALAYPAQTYPGVHETLDILTIGQYLQPTRQHLPVDRWVNPAEFVDYKMYAEKAGIRHCESGPLVRSSYHADEQVLKMETKP